MDSGNLKVTYDVKELLEKMDNKIDSGFKKLFAEIGDHDERIVVLENDRNNKRAARSVLKEAVVMICTLVLAVAGAIGTITALHVHG